MLYNEKRNDFRHNVFVFNTMAQKLWKEQQISFDSNNMKYSHFIASRQNCLMSVVITQYETVL